MLKWTASAFAMAAAMQLGFASAQETNPVIPPGPTGVEAGAETELDAAEDVRDAADEAEAAEAREEEIRDARANLQDARDEVQDDFQRDQPNLNDDGSGTQREARFAPNADGSQVDERVRSATANLDIDDATRSRYRWHNGEWWFKSKSGNWKYHRDGQWQDFDPTSYRSRNSGAAYGSGSGNWIPQGNTNYVQPQQFSASSGYYYQGQPQATQRYNSYQPGYDGRYYRNDNWNSGWNNQRFNQGYGFNQGAGFNQGWGQGYNPANDRFYGQGPYGQPYSISGDQYRGGVIGSQIGGQLGGRTGSIIGGAIGAGAAD